MVVLRTLLCKKGFAKLAKVFIFHFIVSGYRTFEELDFVVFYAFRSSSLSLLFALFLSLDLVMIFFLIRDVRWGLLFRRIMRFLKGATAFKLFIIAVFRDPISPD